MTDNLYRGYVPTKNKRCLRRFKDVPLMTKEEVRKYAKREAGILAIRCKRIIGEATNGDGTIDTGKLEKSMKYELAPKYGLNWMGKLGALMEAYSPAPRSLEWLFSGAGTPARGRKGKDGMFFYKGRKYFLTGASSALALSCMFEEQGGDIFRVVATYSVYDKEMRDVLRDIFFKELMRAYTQKARP